MAKKYISKKIKSKNSKKKSHIKPTKRKSNRSSLVKKKSSTIPLPKKSDPPLKIDPVSHAIFTAESTPKLQCCFCYKNIFNQIKILLEPFPSKSLNQIKGLPFEVTCVNCYICQLSKNSFKGIISNNFLKENEPHRYLHYRIISKMSEPIFTTDWSFEDELKLIGAIEKLGIGNWEDISNIIGKGKYECESHYNTFYYKNEKNFLPNLNNLQVPKKNSEKFKKNKIEENYLLSKIKSNIGYIPFNTDINQQPIRTVINSKKNKNGTGKNQVILQTACNTLGYWPKRNEFDIEFNNDAEIQVMEIDYKENNKKELDKIYKDILMNYNNILEKRDERKNFVIDKNLFDIKKQLIYEKKLNKEDREIYQSMKQYLKYLTNEQFNKLFEGIILEKNIHSRLNQLNYYQNLGINSIEQIHGYINKLKKNNKLLSKGGNKDNNKKTDKNFSITLRDSTVNNGNKIK